MDYNGFSDIEHIEWLGDGISLEHIGSERDTAWLYEEAEDTVFGNPERDIAFWEKAENEYCAGVYAEKFAIEQLKGSELSEEDLERAIASHSLCSDVFGTALSDVGKISASFDLSVERCAHLELNDFAELLADGNQRVLCLVSGVCLDLDGVTLLPGGMPDRLVEVIGIEQKDNELSKIFINDPCQGGHEIASEVFLRAWGTEDRVGFVIGG